MNICLISQEYPPDTHVGGIGTYTYNMACAFAGLGHTVHVISSTDKENRTIQDEGVSIHRLKKWNVQPTELSRLMYSYAVAKKISAIECKFDMVHASEFAHEAFWFSFNKKYPLVTRLATPFFLVKELNKNAIYGPRPLWNIMEKKQTLNSNGILSSTYALAGKVIQKWKIDSSLVEVIPNSIDITRVIKLSQNNPIPEILKGKEYMVYFGRLEERKGINILARALPEVLKQFPYIYMVFIGSDLGFHGVPMKKTITDAVGQYRERVIFFENQPHKNLFPMLNAAKIVILPSLWEAFGFVCIEAMALGCPIIATSGSGFGEIIEDEISGYLVEPGNHDQLGEKMISVLRDKEGLCRISEGARKRAQDFDVFKIAYKVLAYYEKIIEKSRMKMRSDTR